MEVTGINPKNGVVHDDPKRKTVKIFSNKTNTFYYLTRDPDFYRNYYHERKEKMTCEHCGREVYKHALRRHLETKICQNAKMKKQLADLNQVD